MKNLILVRHAKSSWDYNLSDINRPLEKRGVSDAQSVSMEFKKQTVHFEKVFSSPANRALTTCKIFLNALDISENSLIIKEQLYDFSGEKVVDFIGSIDDNLNSIMIFGHNYAFTSITNRFGSIFIDNLPTSGLVWLQFEIDKWTDIKYGTTKLILKPKDFKI